MKKITAQNLQKDKILQALTTSKDISEASKIAGVSRKTIYSYLKDEDFVLAYRNMKRIQFREISEKIAHGANIATEFLLTLLYDINAPYHAKMQASVKLLELYSKFIDFEAGVNNATFEENDDGFSIAPPLSGL